MKGLDDDVNSISGYLTKKQGDFDNVMDMSRTIIRGAGRAITFLHNDKTAEAEAELKIISDTADRLKKIDENFRYNTVQAYQELTEAKVFYGIRVKRKVLSMSEVGVDEEAYILGLMDVEGELKREILESLRKEDLKSAEWYFDLMKEIYDSTRSIRFAEAVLGGFRKKQDVARIQIENAGSEILLARRKG